MKEDILKKFKCRIEFYGFLEKYHKKGNSVVVLYKSIEEGALRYIKFNNHKNSFIVDKPTALITIHDFIANNNKKAENNQQLTLFPLI